MFHAPASNNVGYSNYILYQTMKKKKYFFLQINQIGYNLLYNSKATHGIPTVIGLLVHGTYNCM
jgi:phage regulator Rha-like protein